MDVKIEIQGHTKCNHRLGIDPKQVFTELFDIHVYRPKHISMFTVFTRVKSYGAGKLSSQR